MDREGGARRGEEESRRSKNPVRGAKGAEAEHPRPTIVKSVNYGARGMRGRPGVVHLESKVHRFRTVDSFYRDVADDRSGTERFRKPL